MFKHRATLKLIDIKSELEHEKAENKIARINLKLQKAMAGGDLSVYKAEAEARKQELELRKQALELENNIQAMQLKPYKKEL